MPVDKECGFCKKHFIVPNRRSDQVKFCSRECKTEAGYAHLTCAQCGQQFKRKQSAAVGAKSCYCSVACSAAARPGRKHAAREDAVRHYKVCLQCGEEFRVTQTRKDTAKWCSRKCQGESPEWRAACAGKQVGDKHWRWAGGVYTQNDGYVRQQKSGVTKRTFEHRQTILELMLAQEPNHPFLVEVDGVKKISSEIEVHHIDRDRANNAPDNLLAVTKHAHAQIHHRNRKPMPWECWPSNPTRW